jgi:ParB/RepB/Spo0J family partition protein
MARPKKDGGYELAFGMTRLEAIKMLTQEGAWQGGIPVQVRDLTDAEMNIIALVENSQRKDLTPLEQYRAYRKALDTVPGLTMTALAQGLRIELSTLSNNLRILKLPQVVLERVESGELAPSAAREFLCLMNEDHCHTEDMAWVVNSIAGRHAYRGAPDWRAGYVRDLIMDRVCHNEEGWRPLAGPSKEEKHQGFTMAGGLREPSFDVEAFQKEHPQHIHQVPRQEGGQRPWTCLVKEWQRVQTRGTRELNLRLEKGGVTPQPVTEREKRIEQVLARDPLVSAVVQGFSAEKPKLAAKLKTPEPEDIPQDKAEAYKKLNRHLEEAYQDLPGPDRLEQLEAEAENIREDLDLEEVLTLEEVAKAIGSFGARTKKEQKAKPVDLGSLGTRVDKVVNLGRHRGFDAALNKSHYQGPPAYFPDLEECLKRCTKGAGYAEEYQGGPVQLHCFNEACWKEKLERGKAAFTKKFLERAREDDARDRELAEAISRSFRLVLHDRELMAMPTLAHLVATALILSGRDFNPFAPDGLWEFQYEPGTMARVRELLGLPEPQRQGRWSCLPARGEVLKALSKAPKEALPQIAAQVLVYALAASNSTLLDTFTKEMAK